MNQILYTLSFLGLFLSMTHVSFAQSANMSISIVGTFNDENNDGLAQTGETILMTCTIVNTGTIALDSITVGDSNPITSTNPILLFNVKGPIYNLLPNQMDNTTYSCLYSLNIQDILNGSVSHIAHATGRYLDPNNMFPSSIHDSDDLFISFMSQPPLESEPMIETETGDVYINESENGVILKSPSGNCFRLRVEDNGVIRSVPVNCP